MNQSTRWSISFWILVCFILFTPVVTVVPYLARVEVDSQRYRRQHPEGLRLLNKVRQANPIVPLGERLPGKNRSLDFKNTARNISSEEENDLSEFEYVEPRSYRQTRGFRLSSLHQHTLNEFAESVGFGVDRIWYIASEGSLKLTDEVPPLIPLADVDVATAEERPISQRSAEPDRLSLLPRLHRSSFQDFVDPQRLGIVVSSAGLARTVTWNTDGNRVIEEVRDWSNLPADSPLRPLSVGHTEHSMSARAKHEFKRHLTGWQLSKLELVSLLKSPTPRVYLSRNLPNMKELANAPTRELNTFESESLAKIQNGEGLQIESDNDEIRMMGSVRAASQCVDCHTVKRGALLGAFTYVLHRTTATTENAQASLGQ